MLLVCIALCFAVEGRGAARPPSAKPNFLLFFVDDLGYGDVGFTGAPSSLTPNLDYYAFTGRRLSTWYSGYPVCSASRTALLTGRQPPRVGMPGVVNSLAIEGLPLNETTIADFLRGAGYKTGIAGKWHQGQRPEYLPLSRGFDAFYGLPFSVDDGVGYCSNCGPNEAKHVEVQIPSDAWPLPLIHQTIEKGSVIVNQPTDLEPLSRSIESFVKDFITTHREEPWFMYLAHPHVHTASVNIQQLGFEQYAGCSFANKTSRGPFGDALAELDWLVGSIIGHVASLGIAENTLVLFTSDNGPWFIKDQGGGAVGPFTGRSAGYLNTWKGSTWEGGIREPAFVYWPGTVAQGSRSLETFSTLDILPTFLYLAGVGKPKDLVLDGINNYEALMGVGSSHSGWRDRLLPFWNGPDYFQVGTDVYAGRWNQYKFHWRTSTGCPRQTTLGNVTAHTLENITIHDPPLVFDVMADPSEAYPLSIHSLPHDLLKSVEEARVAHRSSMWVRSIDPRFGTTWLLCCDLTRKCRCSEPVPLPPSSADAVYGSRNSYPGTVV